MLYNWRRQKRKGASFFGFGVFTYVYFKNFLSHVNLLLYDLCIISESLVSVFCLLDSSDLTFGACHGGPHASLFKTDSSRGMIFDSLVPFVSPCGSAGLSDMSNVRTECIIDQKSFMVFLSFFFFFSISRHVVSFLPILDLINAKRLSSLAPNLAIIPKKKKVLFAKPLWCFRVSTWYVHTRRV